MFEVPVDKQETKIEHERIGISILVLLLIAGIAFYFIAKHNTKLRISAPAVATAPADPVKDLKIVRATMTKDRMGTTAVWLVTLRNQSSTYTYTNIRYETSYVGPDNKQILVNHGTVPATYAPGDELNSEIRDTLYPDGTAWYRFKIIEAKAAVR
jgi:uncharacterized protein (UPF0333 family)